MKLFKFLEMPEPPKGEYVQTRSCQCGKEGLRRMDGLLGWACVHCGLLYMSNCFEPIMTFKLDEE